MVHISALVHKIRSGHYIDPYLPILYTLKLVLRISKDAVPLNKKYKWLNSKDRYHV
jgi:hypothetical protein